MLYHAFDLAGRKDFRKEYCVKIHGHMNFSFGSMRVHAEGQESVRTTNCALHFVSFSNSCSLTCPLAKYWVGLLHASSLVLTFPCSEYTWKTNRLNHLPNKWIWQKSWQTLIYFSLNFNCIVCTPCIYHSCTKKNFCTSKKHIGHKKNVQKV